MRFKTNIPWVNFESFSYSFPSPDIAIMKDVVKKTPTGTKISLHMPGDFTESADADWRLEDTYRSTGNMGAALTANAIEVGKKIGGEDAGKVLATAKASSGKLPFPTDISIFQAINPLSFTLTFNLIPFNKAEGDTIINIVKTFKREQMPNVDGDLSNVLLKFPNIWDISFEGINGLAYNDESKYENMALTQCSVAYISGTEGASVYSDKNPTQIKLTLGFTGIQKFYLGNATASGKA